jgi:hypothetical protein
MAGASTRFRFPGARRGARQWIREGEERSLADLEADVLHELLALGRKS